MSCEAFNAYMGGYACRHQIITKTVDLKKLKLKINIVKDLNVKIEGDGKTLTVLQGEALTPKEPEVLNIVGHIDTVKNFLEGKKDLFPADKVLIIVEEERGNIQMLTDFDNPYGHQIEGRLILLESLQELKINQGATYGLKDLISALKFKRLMFADEGVFNKIIQNLMSFNAKIETEIIKANDNKGNLNDSVIMKAQTNLELNFTLKTPIWKGGAVKTFRVEVMFEIRDRNTSFWMESYEMNDLMKEERSTLLDEQVKVLSAGYTVLKK